MCVFLVPPRLKHPEGGQHNQRKLKQYTSLTECKPIIICCNRSFISSPDEAVLLLSTWGVAATWFFFHQAVTDLFLEMDDVVLIHFSVTLHVSNCLNQSCWSSQVLISTHHLSIVYLLRRMIDTDKLDITHPATQCTFAERICHIYPNMPPTCALMCCE